MPTFATFLASHTGSRAMARSTSSGSMAAKAPKSDYEVIVGNIGTVYRGTSFAAAQKNFATYREQSQSGYGRAAGESVTLMRDGEVIREFDAEAEGSMARKNNMNYPDAPTITDNDLRSLHREAAYAGNAEQAALCTLALLGRSALGKSGPGTVYRKLLESGATKASARKECADLVRQARMIAAYNLSAWPPKRSAREIRMGKASSEGSMAAKAPKSDYEVIVGNIGTVYRGTSFAAAQKNFATYREQSQSGYGRAAGESVTLMRDGEVIREFDAEAEGSMDRVNKYEYLLVLQGYFAPSGWEDLTAVEKKGSGFDRDANREIKADLKAYRENDPRAYRVINRKTLRS